MLTGRKFRPEDVLRIARRRGWLVILPCAIVAGLTAVVARQLPDRYRSETLILVVPQRVPDAYVKSTVTARIEDRLESISQQILSRTRLERIINDFKLYPRERQTQIMEDVVERMRRDITVQVVKGDAFRVSYTGGNATTVMKVTERLASMFIEENLRDREVLAEGTSQFLEAQLEDARRRLIEQEKKIEEYRERYSGQLPSQLQSNLQVIQNTQLQIQALTDSLDRDRERRLVLERTLHEMAVSSSSSSPSGAVALGARGDDGGTAVRLATPAEQLHEAQAILRALQARLKPTHPDVVRAKLLIDRLEKTVASQAGEDDDAAAQETPLPDNGQKALRLDIEQLDREIARKEQQEQHLRAAAAAYQHRVDAVPGRESELAELTRDYTTLQSMYTTLLAKKEDSRIAANLERRQIGEQFKLLDPARRPEKPYSPNRQLINLGGIAAGLFIGLALVTLLEYRDSTFETDDDVMQVLQIPVLGVVPVIASPGERRRMVIKRAALASGLLMIVVAGFGTVIYTFLR